MNYKAVAQEHGMGCGVACTASLLGKSYSTTLKLFNEKQASTRGYYLRDIVRALDKKEFNYTWSKVTNKTKKYLKIPGSIVFVKRSKIFLAGHYLLKVKEGWMNPWINYPKISPAKAGFQKNLPGKAQGVLYKK